MSLSGMTFLVLGMVSSFAISVQAKPVFIQEHRCVQSSMNKIHALFTGYDRYSTLPGSEYKVGGASVLKIIKSQSLPPKEKTTDDVKFVWMVLQPVNLTDSSLYPKFLMKCETMWVGAARFQQNCIYQTSKMNFGLNDLKIQIQANKSDARCNTDQAGVDVTVSLNTNGAQVAQIKDAVMKSSGSMASLIDAIFDEEWFFKSFYESVYSNWLGTLSP